MPSTVPAVEITTVLASQVRPGDLISELDTPDGPFYPVLRVEPGALVLDARTPEDVEDDLDVLEVAVPIGPTSGVRRIAAPPAPRAVYGARVRVDLGAGATGSATWLPGGPRGNAYLTHDVDPGLGPMSYPTSMETLTLLCGVTVPAGRARAVYQPSSGRYTAVCTCGWTGPDRAALVAHAVRA